MADDENQRPPRPKGGERGYQVQEAFAAFWNAVLDVDEETDDLKWPKSIGTYDRMRKQDAQVVQTLRAVLLPIMRTPWRVDPNGIDPESPEWAIVEHVADDLGLPIKGQPSRPLKRTRNRFDWGEHLRLALLCLTFGHSFFEQVYEIRNGLVHLKKLAWRPPRTISKISVAGDGGLDAIWQFGRTGVVNDPEGIEIGIDRLVAYVNEREGGNWLGTSLLRPAYKNWLVKDRLIRVQAQTIDRNGMGFPVHESAPVPANMPTEDAKAWMQAQIDDGYDIATGMRSGDNSGASIANGAKLNLLGVEGTLPDADKPIRYHDEQIGKAVLANFLNLGGDNSTGSYALGDTFADFFTLSLQSVGLNIAAIANAHIVEDIVDLNWGPDAPSPRLVFDEIGTRHPVTAQAIYQLVQVGAIRMDDPLEEYLRTAWGLPARDETTTREALKTASNAPDPTVAALLGPNPHPAVLAALSVNSPADRERADVLASDRVEHDERTKRLSAVFDRLANLDPAVLDRILQDKAGGEQ